MIKTLCLLVFGLIFLFGKKIGKGSHAIAAVYLILQLYALAAVIRFRIPTVDIVLLLLFIGAYLLGVKSTGESILQVEKVSEASRQQQQTQKQLSIYEQ